MFLQRSLTKAIEHPSEERSWEKMQERRISYLIFVGIRMVYDL